jgi:hypothetical protein
MALWYEQLVRESIQEATGMKLESAAHIARGSTEPKSPRTIGDSEPNHDATTMDSREQE